LAGRVQSGLGIDASRAMLALARVRLAKPEFSHLSVRLADMYALPLHDGCFDLVLLQMVLHYAEDAAAAMAEARRVLAPGGRLLVVDVAPHSRAELRERMAHRALGFSHDDMASLLSGAGLRADDVVSVPGPLTVCIWSAREAAPVAAEHFEDAI
jgi:ArsR family transcriptional regulator